MNNKDFEADVNAELDRRMAVYEQYTAIAPSDGKARHRQWQTNARNRGQVRTFQKTETLDSSEINNVTYPEWLNQFNEKFIEADPQFRMGSPEFISEEESYFFQAPCPPRFSDGQKTIARKMLANLGAYLSPRQLQVFERRHNGMSAEDVGEELGMCPQAVNTHYIRAVNNLRRAFMEHRK